MLEVQPKDERGYFMLPQAPEEAGYYVYGNVGHKPNTGALAQYAHPAMLSLIFAVEREWQARDDRKFGIGNISIAGGLPYDGHGTHQLGIETDIRPVRKDMMVGQAAHVTRFDAAYDREATIQLIWLFAEHPNIRLVYFNDDKIQAALGGLVRSMKGHDDHFHIEIKLPKAVK